MKHRLKIIIVLLILTGYLLLTERLLFWDVIFIFLTLFIPAYIFSNVEYLFKRTQDYRKYMVSKLFTNLIVAIFIFSVIVFVTRPKYVPRDSVVSDLKFMVSTLENVHPDIYHVISRDSFTLILNKEIDNLPERITELEFFKICARLTSHFRTGHTRPMENLLLTHYILGRAFPFETKIIDEKLYVINNLSLFNSVPIGSEIIEINSKSINQVISEWSRLVSYENNAYRNNLITRPISIGIWNDFKSFKIKYIDQDTREIKEKVVNGGFASNMYSNLKSRVLKPQNFIYRELTPEIGYIGFFSCMDLKNYQEFYTSTFNTLKINGIQHLIIDTRDNGGGHSIIATELMQFIFHQPFKEADSAIVKVSEEIMATGKVERKLGEGNKEIGKTYTRIPGLYRLKENPLRFSGKTYLLTNNGTFSAGQGFASAYKCYGQGTIIGEETGGTTVSFGDVHIFNLPNTGLKIMTSWDQAFSACGIDNQRGVMPDYEVKYTITDYVNRKDRVMELTMNLIKENI